MTGFFKRNNPLHVSVIILCTGFFLPLFSQIVLQLGSSSFTSFSPAKGVRWGITQNWNDTTGKWGDTNTLSIITRSENDLPVELVTKHRNLNNQWVDFSKNTMTYDNGRITGFTLCYFLPDSGKYSNFVKSGWYAWKNDSILENAVFEYDLMAIIEENILNGTLDSATLEQYEAFFPHLQDVKYTNETIFTNDNGKYTSELNSYYVSGLDSNNFQIGYLVLGLVGMPSDTELTDNFKYLYEYGNNNIRSQNYYWNSMKSAWDLFETDSLVFDNGKPGILFSTLLPLDTPTFKCIYTYDSLGRASEACTYTVSGDHWVANSREIYFYDQPPYESVRFSSVRRHSPVNMTMQYNGKHPVIDVFIDKSDYFSWTLTDLRGRVAASGHQEKFRAGVNHIFLQDAAQGHYILSLKNKEQSFAAPVNIFK